MATVRSMMLAWSLRLPRSLFSKAIPPTCRAEIRKTAVPITCHGHSFVRQHCHGRIEAVPLAYTHYEPEDTADTTLLPPIILLHCMFGSRSNWDAVSSAIATATGRNVFAVDLRNHGDSPHTDDMDYPLMSADLELFLRDRGFSKASFVGHSLGGRVAMKFAVTRPDAVERLVLEDVAPTYLPAVLREHWLPWQAKAMDTIMSLFSRDMSLEQARQMADRFLSSRITNRYVREFLLANLREGHVTLEWRLNAKAIKQNIETLTALDYLDNQSCDVDALFIGAADFICISAECQEDIRQSFPNARIVSVKGTSHWVHNDKPEEFVVLVRDFMSACSSECFEGKEIRFENRGHGV
uniref:sn-1-specific diacylglycerol lipase ABHD11 n=1 Tax=Amblyomma maculatum TaxID=34609 RepID=G3MNQ1_AMBMU